MCSLTIKIAARTYRAAEVPLIMIAENVALQWVLFLPFDSGTPQDWGCYSLWTLYTLTSCHLTIPTVFHQYWSAQSYSNDTTASLEGWNLFLLSLIVTCKAQYLQLLVSMYTIMLWPTDWMSSYILCVHCYTDFLAFDIEFTVGAPFVVYLICFAKVTFPCQLDF